MPVDRATIRARTIRFEHLVSGPTGAFLPRSPLMNSVFLPRKRSWLRMAAAPTSISGSELHQRVNKPAETWGNFRRVPFGSLAAGGTRAEPSGFSPRNGRRCRAVPQHLSLKPSQAPRENIKAHERPGKGSAICGRAGPIHQTAGSPISAVPVNRVVQELNAFRCDPPVESVQEKAQSSPCPPKRLQAWKPYSRQIGTL